MTEKAALVVDNLHLAADQNGTDVRSVLFDASQDQVPDHIVPVVVFPGLHVTVVGGRYLKREEIHADRQIMTIDELMEEDKKASLPQPEISKSDA